MPRISTPRVRHVYQSGGGRGQRRPQVLELRMYNKIAGLSRWCITRVVLQPSEAHDIVEEEELSFALDHHHTLLSHGIDGVEDGVNVVGDRVEITTVQVSE
jgi:hypothetical protein